MVLALSACAPGGGGAPDLGAGGQDADAASESSASEAGAATGADAPATALRFEDGSAASGITFRHEAGYTSERLLPETMAAGLALADFDRDGALDLLLANGGRVWRAERPEGAGDRLYLGNGDGTFRDATEAWGLEPGTHYGQGVAVGDIDGDGWVDAFLSTQGAGDRLLRNTGGTGFEDITEASGAVKDPGWGSSAGFFDLEGDGDLDLWAVRYIDFFSESDVIPCYDGDVLIYCTPRLYNAQADRLLRNEGDGRFTDISTEAGLDGRKGKGLALVIGDLDLDGDSDVYLANDLTANHLWINEGGGALREIGMRAGVALSAEGREEAGMGADMSDFDGDGLLDLANTNFQSESTSILRQSEGMVFDEVSDPIGIGMTARQRLSWGLDFFDADNDGDEDLIMVNGHIYDNAEEFLQGQTFAQLNTLYENLGGTFADVTASAGSALADLQVTRGVATGDLDGDGLLDFVTNNNGGAPQVALNRTADPGRFVSLWLEGRGAPEGANRNAIGAWARARVGEREIVRQVFGAQSYLSVSDFRLHFGLGEAEAIDRLEIHWPGQAEPQVVENLAADRFYRVVQGEAPVTYVPGEGTIAPAP
jgi:hypothetical protein